MPYLTVYGNEEQKRQRIRPNGDAAARLAEKFFPPGAAAVSGEVSGPGRRDSGRFAKRLAAGDPGFLWSRVDPNWGDTVWLWRENQTG